MKIDLEAIRPVLADLLNGNIEGDITGGVIAIDQNGKITDPGKGAHTFIEIQCSEEEFRLLLNPKLRFRVEVDLMDEDIPDTVEETLDYLAETIEAAAGEYEECFD